MDEERRRAENSISSLVRSLHATNQKVKPLLKASLLEASQEEATIRAALAKIHEIRSIRNERRIQGGLERFSKTILLDFPHSS